MKVGPLSVCFLVLVIGGCATSGTHAKAKVPAKPDTVAVNGQIVLTGESTIRQDDFSGAACWASGNAAFGSYPGPFDDIKEGAQVVVTDASGATVGLGTLASGHTTRASKSTDRTPCAFAFTVSKVPSGQRFYGVRVGSMNLQVAASHIASPTITLTP